MAIGVIVDRGGRVEEAVAAGLRAVGGVGGEVVRVDKGVAVKAVAIATNRTFPRIQTATRRHTRMAATVL